MRTLTLAAVTVLFLLHSPAFAAPGAVPSTDATATGQAAKTPVAAEQAEVKPTGPVYIRIETTMGPLTAVLDPRRAPITVANFLQYVDAGFYDGLAFHRVIANFMIQTGGFEPDLRRREPFGPNIKNESSNGLSNRRGALAMARQADPDSAQAQFFINTRHNRHLDQSGYTVFGQLINGFTVMEDIELTETTVVRGLRDVPLKPIVVERIRRVSSPIVPARAMTKPQPAAPPSTSPTDAH